MQKPWKKSLARRNYLCTAGQCWLLALLLAGTLSNAIAAPAQDLYPFVTPQQQAQFARLTAQLRCVVCQNESLADSSAPLAADLRQVIAQQIQQGQSDAQITSYLVMRYGNFVRYEPPLLPVTYLLWGVPFVLFIGGVYVVIRLTRVSRTGKT